METSVTPSPFPGDPGHEGGMKPMHHLKGSTGPVHTQMPDDQSTNYENHRGESPSPWKGWDSTTLASTGGSRGVGGTGLYKGNKGH